MLISFLCRDCCKVTFLCCRSLCCQNKGHESKPSVDDAFGRGGVIDDILLTARDEDDDGGFEPKTALQAGRVRRTSGGFANPMSM